MTKYHVLREVAGAAASATQPAPSWKLEGTVEAASAKAAVLAHVKDAKGEPGRFVAVPARSWQPVKVATETQIKLKLS